MTPLYKVNLSGYDVHVATHGSMGDVEQAARLALAEWEGYEEVAANASVVRIERVDRRGVYIYDTGAA